MQNREINAFWKECRKHTISKSALSICVDGVTGEADIADMWRIHYEELLNCNTNTDEMVTILDTFGTVCSHDYDYDYDYEISLFGHRRTKNEHKGIINNRMIETTIKNINISKHDTKLINVVRLVIVIKCAPEISLVQVF